MNQTGNPMTHFTANPVNFQNKTSCIPFYTCNKKNKNHKSELINKKEQSVIIVNPDLLPWFRRLPLSLLGLLSSFHPPLLTETNVFETWVGGNATARAEIKISLFTALRVGCAISICTVWPRDIYSSGLSFLYCGVSFPSPWCVHMLITSGILGHGGTITVFTLSPGSVCEY